MGKAELLQELIYSNLCLLKAAGHHINVEQDMFKDHNLPGFEAVGYALLMIIDQAECKGKIPWPLINDKAQSREFRANFSKFIKMINTKYPDAKIPEMNPSSFQYPGGLRFLDFMHKLSTFALELELKKILSSEEQEDMLSKPLTCQPKGQKINLMVLKGALQEEMESLSGFSKYAADSHSTIKKMSDCLDNITTTSKNVFEQLEEKVSSLDFDDRAKASLLDIEDSTAITDYNERVEKKYVEIERNCYKLSELHDLAVQCCQHSDTSKPTSDDNLCLDGGRLELNRFLNELASGAVLTVDGSVKLLEIVKAGHTAVTRLTTTSGSSSLLMPAQDLQVRSTAAANRTLKAELALKHLLLEKRQEVITLRPVVYSRLNKGNIPEVLKHLKERPPFMFVRPETVSKTDDMVKPGPKRKSFGTIIQRKNKVVCSYKVKREQRKHVSSTPFFKTPASRKSLNNTLAPSTVHKRIEKDKHIKSTLTKPIPSSPAVSINQVFEISESSAQPSPALHKRKSINDVVQRFLKLKESMNKSSISNNESCSYNE